MKRVLKVGALTNVLGPGLSVCYKLLVMMMVTMMMMMMLMMLLMMMTLMTMTMMKVVVFEASAWRVCDMSQLYSGETLHGKWDIPRNANCKACGVFSFARA